VRYPKECVLKDCQETVIRPLTLEDEQALAAFYSQIPATDRWCMRYDATQPEVLKMWFTGISQGTAESIVAECDSRIVGHGSLHIRGFGVSQHVGRFRIVVLPEYRQQRLGTWLMLDLIQLAMDRGLEMLRTDLVAGLEDAAIEAATKFDFFKSAVLQDYAKDPEGQHHDMVIMIKRLHNVWSDY
jgi:L-amino acid N-acyltransferase YncA